MYAGIELWCKHAGIVRIGPKYRRYGDPYLYAIPFRIANGYADFEGLDVRLPLSAFRAAVHAVRAIGLEERWRRRDGSIRAVCAVRRRDQGQP